MFDQWLDFSAKEISWIKGNQDYEKLLCQEMSPDEVMELVRKKLLRIHKDAQRLETSVAYFRYGPEPGKDAELYQLKVFFYFGKDQMGAALCESFLVTEKGGVLLQRRGAAEK